MKKSSTRRKAGWVWLVALAVPGIYDLWALPKGHESASGALWRLLTAPRWRWPLRVFVLVLGKHLFAPRLLPKTDPFLLAGQKLRGDEN